MQLRHWAALERRVVELQPDPLADALRAIAETKPEEKYAQMLLALAYPHATQVRQASIAEIHGWLNSIEGAMYLAYLLVKDFAQVTEQEVVDLVGGMSIHQRGELDGALASVLTKDGTQGN